MAREQQTKLPPSDAATHRQELSPPAWETAQATADDVESRLVETDTNDAKQALAESLAEIILSILSTKKFAVCRALVSEVLQP